MLFGLNVFRVTGTQVSCHTSFHGCFFIIIVYFLVNKKPSYMGMCGGDNLKSD